MTRHLLVATRIVTDRDSYLERWQVLRDAVYERGGQAWMFVSADDDRRFIEFIEWKQAEQGTNLMDDAAVQLLRADLVISGLATEQLWKELETR